MNNDYSIHRIPDIRDRVFQFSLRIIRLVSKIPKNCAGRAISDQIMKSGTSIGANIEEAQSASTKKDFIRGITISLKEARETNYWLKLLIEATIIKKELLEKLMQENIEIIKILTVIRKNSKRE
jgi:four helix bundle protein